MKKGVCDRCGSDLELDALDWRKFSSWRTVDDKWEHKCEDVHPQVGHCGRLISHEEHAANKQIENLHKMFDMMHVPADERLSVRLLKSHDIYMSGLPHKIFLRLKRFVESYSIAKGVTQQEIEEDVRENT